MRGQNNIVEVEQRFAGIRWFFAAHPVLLRRSIFLATLWLKLLVDDRASGRIDEESCLLHHLKLRLTDHMSRPQRSVVYAEKQYPIASVSLPSRQTQLENQQKRLV